MYTPPVHGNPKEIIDRVNTTTKEQLGNFDPVDEITEKLFSDNFDQTTDEGTMDPDVQIIGVYVQPSMATFSPASLSNIESHSKRSSAGPCCTMKRNSSEKQSNRTVLHDLAEASSTELSLAKVLQIDFDEIPNYLSKMNPSFQTKLASLLPTTKNLEQFRSIAILFHRILCIKMIDSLWTVYRKAGMGQLDTQLPSTNGIEKKIWLKQIRSCVEDETTASNQEDHACVNFVDDCRRQLTEKSEAYQRELCRQSSRVSGYTPQIEDTLEKLVQRGLRCVRLEINCHLALIQYNYIDELCQRHCLAQNPSDRSIPLIERLCQHHYDQETIKHEINFLKEKSLLHLNEHPFDAQFIVQSPLINSIGYLQQQLYVQYKTLTEQARTNRLSDYLASIDKQMQQSEKQFGITMNEISTMNQSLPHHQQLTSMMLNLIDQRLVNITARVACIYKFKTQLFDIELSLRE